MKQKADKEQRKKIKPKADSLSKSERLIKNFSQTDQEKKRIIKLAIVEMREVTTSQIFQISKGK